MEVFNFTWFYFLSDLIDLSRCDTSIGFFHHE